MSKHVREKSETGFYHVMVRGVNKQNIFADNSDRIKFLFLLKTMTENVSTEIHAFCLMENHIHILIHTEGDNLSAVMQKILLNYVRYFNKKYNRVGHLFESRFKSECINDESYYLTVLRYILQNPEKALICCTLDYRWSSIRAFFNQSFVKTGFAESLFATKADLIHFITARNNDECLDLKLTAEEEDTRAQMIIKIILGRANEKDIDRMSRSKRNYYLREMKKNGVSIRRISSITGIAKSIVARA